MAQRPQPQQLRQCAGQHQRLRHISPGGDAQRSQQPATVPHTGQYPRPGSRTYAVGYRRQAL